jgi:hypothetical protein
MHQLIAILAVAFSFLTGGLTLHPAAATPPIGIGAPVRPADASPPIGMAKPVTTLGRQSADRHGQAGHDPRTRCYQSNQSRPSKSRDGLGG